MTGWCSPHSWQIAIRAWQWCVDVGSSRHCGHWIILCCRQGGAGTLRSAKGLLDLGWHAAVLTSVSSTSKSLSSCSSHCALSFFIFSCSDLTCSFFSRTKAAIGLGFPKQFRAMCPVLPHVKHRTPAFGCWGCLGSLDCCNGCPDGFGCDRSVVETFAFLLIPRGDNELEH